MDVTLWYRQAKKDDGTLWWDYNHLEDGYDAQRDKPTPKCSEHKNWSRATWQAIHASLVDGVVVKH